MITCEQFAKIADHNNPEDVTRAERARMLHHLRNCPACRFLCFMAEEEAPPLSPEQEALWEQMIDDDLADPEFTHDLGGEG